MGKNKEGLTRKLKVKKVNLFMDSTDKALEGKVKNAKTEPYYSKKLTRLGRRYMIVFEGMGTVRGIWGRYSPKMRDNNFTESHKTNFAEELQRRSNY